MTNAKPHIALAITLGEIGGAQRFVLGFARWLTQRDYRVTLLVGDGAWLETACKQEGLAVIRLQHMGRSLNLVRDAQAFAELTRVLRTLKPDVIHLNSTKMGALGSLAARFVRVPRVVYRIGGWVFLEPLRPAVKALYRFIERVSARWKDVIICVHPADALLAAEARIRPRQRIDTVPNGIDMETFSQTLLGRDTARTQLNLAPDQFVFGTVAGFYPPKNLPRYLDACALVHAQLPNTRFVLLGDGPERPRIEARIQELQLNDIVILAGTMDGQASRFLRAFDSFVLPSVKEGMPWALLEAMAARLPCIATDVGANAWMLQQEAGWIVSKDNAAQLAATMIEVVTRPEEAQIRGENAHQAVATHFPLEKTYQDNLKTLLE